MGVGRQMLTLLAITVALIKGDGLDGAVVHGTLGFNTIVGNLQDGRKTAMGIKLRLPALLIPIGILRLGQ